MKKIEGQEDLRIRRTHKLLWESLMAELSVRPFEEITVKDICEQAMVHRTTFYKHYEDKYALLEQGMRQMYNALQLEVNTPSSESSTDDLLSTLIRIFIHVAEHQRFYTLMLCGEGVGRFRKLVEEYIIEHTEIKMSALTSANRTLAVPPVIHAQFFAGAFISILTWWLDNDISLSPQQMAHYFLALHAPLFPHCA